MLSFHVEHMFRVKHFLRGLMNIFKFFKSHKVFLFGLILSLCLCFIRPISLYASSDYSNSIGTYIDGVYVDYPIPDYDLLSISDLLIRETNFPLTYQQFVNLLDQFSLTTFFVNHTLSDPSYFVDVSYSSSISSPSVTIRFYKSLFSLSSFSYSPHGNFLSLSGAPCFIGNDYFPLPFSVPTSYSESYGFPVINRTYSSSLNFASTYHSNLLSYNCLIVGNDYSSNFGSYVNAFLTSSDYPSCTLVFYFNNGSLSSAFVGLGFYSPVSRPLFNSQPYLSSNISTVGGSFSFDNDERFYGSSGSFPVLSDPSSFSYSVLNHGLVLSEKPFVTPTPIPSPEWVSPTPFPTVTLSPIDLTPIPQYLDPSVLGADGNISDLNGFAGLLDRTFSNFDIFALGSSILEYVYSFSGYFSFILIIPVICLIAFALGRLNQK